MKTKETCASSAFIAGLFIIVKLDDFSTERKKLVPY